MAWVFANWWQVLIVVWFGGFLNELSSATFRSQLSWQGSKLPFAVRLGMWLGPFFWPVHLLFLAVIKRTNAGAVVRAGEYGYEVRRGLDARRLLEDLAVEFPVDPPRHHALMLVDGGDKGDLGIVLQRPDGRWDQLVLTGEDQTLDHNKLVDGICDFVDALDDKREAKTCRFEVRSTDGDLLTLCQEALGAAATEAQIGELIVEISQLNGGGDFLSPQLWKPGQTVILPRVVCLALRAREK